MYKKRIIVMGDDGVHDDVTRFIERFAGILQAHGLSSAYTICNTFNVQKSYIYFTNILRTLPNATSGHLIRCLLRQ